MHILQKDGFFPYTNDVHICVQIQTHTGRSILCLEMSMEWNTVME